VINTGMFKPPEINFVILKKEEAISLQEQYLLAAMISNLNIRCVGKYYWKVTNETFSADVYVAECSKDFARCMEDRNEYPKEAITG
jgi:hypothetical protein